MALAAAPSRAQDKEKPTPADPGYTVLDKGPIHEAFAQPNQRKPEAAPIITKQPPPNVNEQPPDQKPQGENVQWILGYWSWDPDKNDYIWVSGFWRNPPSGRHWVPGYWSQAEGGWQWVSGFWMANDQQDLQHVPQPPASVDSGPSVPAPDDSSIYIPGSWVYRDDGYLWRPGFWSAGHDDWAWTPASYRWTPAGYTYIDGYWDYPFGDRGLLFAPVAFTAPLWTNPAWYYQPSYCIDVGYPGFLASLFFRPAWCSYYYGNYFSPFYRGLGFYPWFSFGARFFDPLFTFVAFHHRFDHGFFPGLRHDFFVQRNNFINNVTVNNITTVNNINRTTINNVNGSRPGALAVSNGGRPGFVKPLNQFHSSTASRTPLSSSQQTSQRIAAQSIRTAGLQRSNFEPIGRSVQVSSALRSASSAAVINSRSQASIAGAVPGVTYHSPGYGRIVPGATSYPPGPGTGQAFYSRPDISGSSMYIPRHQSQGSSTPSAAYYSAARSAPSLSRATPSFGRGALGGASHSDGGGFHGGGGHSSGGGHSGGGAPSGGGHGGGGTHRGGHEHH
jgi:hypothetical protein